MTEPRAVHNLTVDSAIALDSRRERLGFDRLGELLWSIQIKVHGVVGDRWLWVERTIRFDVQFVDADDQRFSNLLRPHFTSGVVMDNADVEADLPTGHVLLDAYVKSWTKDTVGCFVGCVLVIGVHAPDQASVVNFSGYLDATFQGYGAPIDDAGDIDLAD